MKAITVWQPFATLIVAGLKTYETRSWMNGYRGEILIHAAKKPVSEVIQMMSEEAVYEAARLLQEKGIAERLEDLPTGCMVGFANLVDMVKTETEIQNIGEREMMFGDWNSGRYAWKLTDPVRFHERIEAKGQQGMWNYRSNQLNSIMRYYW